VYTGFFEPGHEKANDKGFRQDVEELIRPLNVSHIRYPGGNFLSGYRWEDGVGPKEERPVRRELAWFAIEPNEVGTNEYIDFCREVGCEPMMAVNLGTRGPQDATNLLEYCNVPGGTYYSDLRRSHGYEEPHNIKLWCLGNEMDGPWQICRKTAEEYGRVACETAKMMKWMDDSIELVACGSSFRTMPTYGTWEETVLRHCYEHIDYLSLHQYYQDLDGDVPNFLARNVEMGEFIREVADICRKIKEEKGSDKDVYLSFDEWNVWYHFQKDCEMPEKWIKARPIEEELFDFADTLLVGSMLITLINNSDVVKIACLAQLINVIAPIMTEPNGRAWVQTIYYPFLYSSVYGRGTALAAQVDSPTYSCSVSDKTPFLDCAAVLSKEEDYITLLMVNKNLFGDTIDCSIDLDGYKLAGIEDWVSLHGYAHNEVNTADSAPVEPVKMEGAVIDGNTVTAALPSGSWNMIRVKLAK
ncbi:MAG: alpha-N-arabinofuranosidase, partial [Clostridia bacterium]|nr:alpha-N-arabinofuranosidase [Clostridia bacterium]